MELVTFTLKSNIHHNYNLSASTKSDAVAILRVNMTVEGHGRLGNWQLGGDGSTSVLLSVFRLWEKLFLSRISK